MLLKINSWSYNNSVGYRCPPMPGIVRPPPHPLWSSPTCPSLITLHPTEVLIKANCQLTLPFRSTRPAWLPPFCICPKKTTGKGASGCPDISPTLRTKSPTTYGAFVRVPLDPGLLERRAGPGVLSSSDSNLHPPHRWCMSLPTGFSTEASHGSSPLWTLETESKYLWGFPQVLRV